MKRPVGLLILAVLTISVHAEEKNKELTIDDIFPADRVLDV